MQKADVHSNYRSAEQVFLCYPEGDQVFAEFLALRLQRDTYLSLWFGPWHSVPGVPIQEQMEEALMQSNSCVVLCGHENKFVGWQNEQMRTAIQTRIEDDSDFRIIPVLSPDTLSYDWHRLPTFLRRYESVRFESVDDDEGFMRLVAGILKVPPLQIKGYINSKVGRMQLPLPENSIFESGRALIIGIASYPKVNPLPENVLNDVRDLHDLLTSPISCGYKDTHVTRLLDSEATNKAICEALEELASRTQPNDTVIVFFSGHGAHKLDGADSEQYLIPYDCDPKQLSDTAIRGEDFTSLLSKIKAERLLVLLDCCHSGGIAEPKDFYFEIKAGLSEDYYQILSRGKGRVVIASSRLEETSWALRNMRNSLFTHYLLEALQGNCLTLGDGYVRVFDIFRHVASKVPTHANQHPIFKAAQMEDDFPVAICSSQV